MAAVMVAEPCLFVSEREDIFIGRGWGRDGNDVLAKKHVQIIRLRGGEADHTSNNFDEVKSQSMLFSITERMTVTCVGYRHEVCAQLAPGLTRNHVLTGVV
eukprot:4536457-Pleurochrysis_carterae.AAC.1